MHFHLLFRCGLCKVSCDAAYLDGFLLNSPLCSYLQSHHPGDTHRHCVLVNSFCSMHLVEQRRLTPECRSCHMVTLSEGAILKTIWACAMHSMSLYQSQCAEGYTAINASCSSSDRVKSSVIITPDYLPMMQYRNFNASISFVPHWDTLEPITKMWLLPSSCA